MSLDERIEQIRADLAKQEKALSEAMQEKNAFIATSFLEAASETPWILVGYDVHGLCRLTLNDKKDSLITQKFRNIWKHDYHDSIQTKDLEIRFDDWEYSIIPLKRGTLDDMIKIAEKYSIKIVDTLKDDIRNAEKQLRNLEKARCSIEHLLA